MEFAFMVDPTPGIKAMAEHLDLTVETLQAIKTDRDAVMFALREDGQTVGYLAVRLDPRDHLVHILGVVVFSMEDEKIKQAIVQMTKAGYSLGYRHVHLLADVVDGQILRVIRDLDLSPKALGF